MLPRYTGTFLPACTIAVAVCVSSRSDTRPQLELIVFCEAINLSWPQHILDVRFQNHSLQQGVLTVQVRFKTACGCGTKGFISSAAPITILPNYTVFQATRPVFMLG